MGNRLKERTDFGIFRKLQGSKKTIPFVMIILVIFFCVCPSTAEMLKIRVESGRVRETPDFNAPVEFGVKKGDKVALVKREEDWALIKLDDGRTGWAHQSLFDDPKMPSEPVNPTAASASVETSAENTAASDTQLPVIKEVKDIQVKMTAEGDEKVIFVMNGFYSPEIFALEEAVPKVVCDFADVTLGEKVKKRQIDVDGNFIKKVRIGVYEGEKVRVVLDLSPSKDYDVEQLFLREENLYVLTFKSSQKIADDEPVADKKYGF